MKALTTGRGTGSLRRLGAILAVGGVLGTTEGGVAQLALTGGAGIELRAFDRRPMYEGQRFHSLGVWAAPRLGFEVAPGHELEVAPFVRLLSADASRPVIYFRTLAWSGHFARWRAAAGVRSVRWGVSRAASPVDIVTQKDRSYHPFSNERIGQPMAALEIPLSPGRLELLVLSRLTHRLHGAREDRLRGSAWVREGPIAYGSGAGRPVEVAARWSGAVADAAVGVSAFSGTSRDPAYEPAGAAVTQRYESLRQVAIDIERGVGALTLSAESAVRTLSRSSPFLVSSVGIGGEVRRATAWLEVRVEYVADSRGGRATSSLEDDFYVEARTGVGEARSLTLTVRALVDREGDGSVISAKIDREMPSGWGLALSTWRFHGPDLAALRGDGYVALSLRRAVGPVTLPRRSASTAPVIGRRAPGAR